MKNTTIRLALLFALILGFTVAGCKKDSTTTGPSTQKPTAPVITVTGPKTQSSDTHALQAQSYAGMVNGFAGFAQPYAQMPGTQNGNVWTYTYTVGTFTVTMTATVATNGDAAWKLVYNGTEPGDTTVFHNWVAMEGTTTADGKSGNWKIYYLNSTVLEALFTFSTNAAGAVTSELAVYDEHSVLQAKYKFINNKDGSGELDLYTGTTLIQKITWTSTGSGSWWTYDNNGNQTGHDVWT